MSLRRFVPQWGSDAPFEEGLMMPKPTTKEDTLMANTPIQIFTTNG